MAEFLSLLDITARRGTDQAVGLVEEVTTYAPELEKIMGRTIPGTFYTARVRTAITAAPAFRKAGSGVGLSASNFEQKRFDCFFFDGQLRVDEAIARAAQQFGDSLASLEADEASGVMRAKAIAFGKQLYAGTANDANGFPGLIDFLNAQAGVTDPLTNAAIDQTVNAGGSAAGKCQCVWYIWMHEQGVHFLFGADQGIDIKPWQMQQVADPADATKAYMAWVSNLSGYIGLSSANIRAVGVIKNVDATLNAGSYTKPWTDALDAQLWAKFPVGLKPNLCFASRGAIASLQASRTVTLLANMGGKSSALSGGAGNVAPWPTETVNGVPIIPTDSILAGNQM